MKSLLFLCLTGLLTSFCWATTNRVAALRTNDYVVTSEADAIATNLIVAEVTSRLQGDSYGSNYAVTVANAASNGAVAVAAATLVVETNRAQVAEATLYPRSNPSNYITIGQVPAQTQQVYAAQSGTSQWANAGNFATTNLAGNAITQVVTIVGGVIATNNTAVLSAAGVTLVSSGGLWRIEWQQAAGSSSETVRVALTNEAAIRAAQDAFLQVQIGSNTAWRLLSSVNYAAVAGTASNAPWTGLTGLQPKLAEATNADTVTTLNGAQIAAAGGVTGTVERAIYSWKVGSTNNHVYVGSNGVWWVQITPTVVDTNYLEVSGAGQEDVNGEYTYNSSLGVFCSTTFYVDPVNGGLIRTSDNFFFYGGPVPGQFTLSADPGINPPPLTAYKLISAGTTNRVRIATTNDLANLVTAAQLAGYVPTNDATYLAALHTISVLTTNTATLAQLAGVNTTATNALAQAQSAQATAVQSDTLALYTQWGDVTNVCNGILSVGGYATQGWVTGQLGGYYTTANTNGYINAATATNISQTVVGCAMVGLTNIPLVSIHHLDGSITDYSGNLDNAFNDVADGETVMLGNGTVTQNYGIIRQPWSNVSVIGQGSAKTFIVGNISYGDGEGSISTIGGTIKGFSATGTTRGFVIGSGGPGPYATLEDVILHNENDIDCLFNGPYTIKNCHFYSGGDMVQGYCNAHNTTFMQGTAPLSGAPFGRAVSSPDPNRVSHLYDCVINMQMGTTNNQGAVDGSVQLFNCTVNVPNGADDLSSQSGVSGSVVFEGCVKNCAATNNPDILAFRSDLLAIPTAFTDTTARAMSGTNAAAITAEAQARTNLANQLPAIANTATQALNTANAAATTNQFAALSNMVAGAWVSTNVVSGVLTLDWSTSAFYSFAPTDTAFSVTTIHPPTTPRWMELQFTTPSNAVPTVSWPAGVTWTAQIEITSNMVYLIALKYLGGSTFLAVPVGGVNAPL